MTRYAMTFSGTTLLMFAMFGWGPPPTLAQAQSDGRMDISLTSSDTNILVSNEVNGVPGGNGNPNDKTGAPVSTQGTGNNSIRTDQVTGPLPSNPGSDRSNKGG